ncbi:MAG: hypothetical protein V2A65_06510 [Candidatus Omnitrophota bacterium]
MSARLKRFRVLYAVCCLLVLILPCSVTGQVTLEITRQAIPRIPIYLILPEKLPEFSAVLTRDLERSSYFEPRRVADAGEAPGQVLLTVEPVTDGVDAKLFSSQNDSVPAFHQVFVSQPFNERILAHTAAKEIIERLTGYPAITLTRMAASQKRGNDREIILMDYDGVNSHPLTQDKSINLYPRFSPDRRSVIYTSFVHYWPRVFRQEIAGGKRQVLAAYPGLNSSATFSPEGRYVALSLSKDGNPEIYLLELRTGKLNRLTRHPSADTSPVFFPDGKSLLFVSDRAGGPQIYRLYLNTLSEKRLTFEGSYNTSPAISPDSRFMAYTSRMGGRNEIRLVVLETGQDVVLTGGSGNKEDPSFGPDSRHIVFVHISNHQSNLKVLDIFSREEYIITQDGGYATPDWR